MEEGGSLAKLVETGTGGVGGVTRVFIPKSSAARKRWTSTQIRAGAFQDGGDIDCLLTRRGEAL